MSDLIDELAADADILDDAGNLALSAHTLRHTLATNRLRAGVDIVFVAELLGHARLDTNRRYTLPAHAGLEDAVGRLPTDHWGTADLDELKRVYLVARVLPTPRRPRTRLRRNRPTVRRYVDTSETVLLCPQQYRSQGCVKSDVLQAVTGPRRFVRFPGTSLRRGRYPGRREGC
ncbi:tyrosine-type recombinase/integrase [Streptomyces sp. NPDC059496]|uniref:tyrosine-type recombinase/integrase n=1 Tax=Streptomyces sp. NPDC059496 TaxID=3346851 RepID=UPI00368159F1